MARVSSSTSFVWTLLFLMIAFSSCMAEQLQRKGVFRRVTSVFKSCTAVLDISSEAKDGVYKIKTKTTSGYTKVYCQMTSLRGCTGRGWTMVMKINGSKDTFVYTSNYWSNNQSYNPSGGLTAFDDQETKLATYHSTSCKELCVGMKVANNLKFVSISYNASSLYSLIADDITRVTNISRQKWKSLIVNSSLQQHCNKEGFNIKPGRTDSVYVRIGIIANNERDCYSSDSFIGFGGRPFTYHWCLFQPSLNTCGNVAACHADNGNADIDAMGYIFIR